LIRKNNKPTWARIKRKKEKKDLTKEIRIQGNKEKKKGVKSIVEKKPNKEVLTGKVLLKRSRKGV
jgi:hypothetical protein